MARSPARQAEIRAMDLAEGVMSRAEARVAELAKELPEPYAGRFRSWFTEEYGLAWLNGGVTSFAGSAEEPAASGSAGVSGGAGHAGGGGGGKL